MTAVIHRTPGLIPIEAFTIAGLSAKPNSRNPIGKFGTGLKYAIAVLVRMDISVRIFRGTTEYVFYKQKREFRGKDYYAIRMKKRTSLFARWTYHELPFTTEYGKYWELWQVFRELHANTLDEGGSSYHEEHLVETIAKIGPDETLFVIEDSRYTDTFYEMDKIFLPDGADTRSTSESIQVLNRPSSHIYFRGMRIMDLKKDAMFTYNFLEDVALTEDRTAKHPSLLEARIVGMMQESDDTAFVERVVSSPSAHSWEYGLHHGSGYTSAYATPRYSRTYLEAAKDSPISTAKEVWNGQLSTVNTDVRLDISIPVPYLNEEEIDTLKEYVLGFNENSTIRMNGVLITQPLEEEILF